jgi:hypothetical protein
MYLCMYLLYYFEQFNNKEIVLWYYYGSVRGYVKSRHSSITGSLHLTAIEMELETKALSCARQSIEWDYGSIGNQWSYLAFKRGLRLREQQVCNNSIVCMLLYNAWVALNGSITSHNFDCEPPTLSDWTSRGPRLNRVNNIWDD